MIGEDEVVAAGCGAWLDGDETMIPADEIGRDGVEEHLAEVAAVDFGAVSAGDVGLAEVEDAVFVVDVGLLVFVAGDALELRGEVGGGDGVLAGVSVHVERAALVADGGAGFALEDGDGNVVEVEDAGEDEAAGAGSDDGDAGWWHGGTPYEL